MRIALTTIFPLVACFLLFVEYASSQPKCKVEYYSPEQGLSHKAVNVMVKDQEGFMWFGSWNGINRFDGRKFVSYKSSPGDSSQLGSDRIERIVEDQLGHLWIQAYDRQIYRFDKRTERFLPLSTVISPNNRRRFAFNKILAASNGLVWLQSLGEGIFCVPQNDLSKNRIVQYKKGLAGDYRLPSNTINFFYEDRDQQVWIGTTDGLCLLTRSPGGTYKNTQKVPVEIGTGLNILGADEDESAVYFRCADGKLVTYDKRSKKFSLRKIAETQVNGFCRSKRTNVMYFTTAKGELLTLNLADQKITTTKYASGEALYAIYEDQSGVLWIEPESQGVVRFAPSLGSFQSFRRKTNESISSIGNRFRVIEDNNGLIWINMKGGGFGYFNEAKASVSFVINTPDGAPYQLPNVVYNIYYDKSGVLWLNTNERQLVKLILQGNDFRQQLLTESNAALTANEVRGILSDNRNRLWLAAKSGKIYVYQGDKLLTGLFDNEPKDGFGPVYTMLQDSRGNIWLGTKGNGLYKASPTNSQHTKYHLTHFQPNTTAVDSLYCKEIYALLEDRQARIWIGSFDEGLSLVVEDGKATRFIRTGNAFQNYPKEAFKKIRHMALDGSGNIWIGTTDGLLLLDANDSHSPVYKYTTYNKVPGNPTSLGNNDIQFIYRDTKNRMWMGTSGGGFCLANGNLPLQSLHFTNYTTRDGMPNDYVLSCAEDKQGNLWIATENGLSKFNPESKVFRNYDSYDGLPKASFSEAAVCRQRQAGQLVFGTTKGFIAFDPALINKNRIAANIALTNLQINNKDAEPGVDGSFIQTDISYIAQLKLEYDQNIISIDYAILDQRASSQQAFAYRLVGFDSTWHDDRKLRRATYTNLPPGKYVFEVKSLSTDLYSNTPYRRLEITILPPPWKTWWAYTLYVIFFGVLLYFIWRYAIAMILLRNKIVVEQRLAALKLNFFTNVSHELRTPLTLIVNPLEQLSKKGKLSPEELSWLNIASKNAARMVRFVNQLLDLRKVESGKATLSISRVEMVTFTRKIVDYFAEAARSSRIKMEVVAEQKELFAWVDAEKLDVVIYNLVGNAIKFTPAGKAITIAIANYNDEQSFSIAVYDQGPGVPTEKLEEIFELFNEGDYSGGRASKGTGIGLALSKEFVDLHGGKIWAENNEDGGLTVTVKLKSGSEHYKPGSVSLVDLPRTTTNYETPIEQQLLAKPQFSSAPKDSESPLVLLVEDNDELRAFIKEQLGEFYRVDTACDGEEGFAKATTILPDLIVSDIMMPKMDGIQMLNKVKNDVNTSHIPVVLLSAKYSIESQIEGLRYGADYYITKPFNNEFLIASIDNLLRQRKKLFEALIEKKRNIELSPRQVVITSKDETFLKDVIKVVTEKMLDSDFNIENLAGMMAMNSNTFSRKFKSLAGLTPVEFVRDMRLQRAKQLLDVGGSNVSEVAYEVGFSNPKYFSTCFKEKYHVSPSDYLKSKMY